MPAPSVDARPSEQDPSVVLAVGRLVTSSGERAPAWVTIRDGLIADVGGGRPPRPVDEDIADAVVLPGFVDAHAHGALGHDFRSCDADGARAVAAHHLAAGTTDLMASIGTAPSAVLERQLALLAPLVRDGTLVGLHLEGPYLSPERRGAHDPSLLRLPDLGELRRLLDAAAGTLTMVTLAPELPGAAAAIRLLVERGVRVAIGHTACSAEAARAALADGASAFTHLFNGMPPISGRDPGPVAAALESETAHVEVIGDGLHLADETLRLVRRVAPGRVALVSDAMQATGLGDGEYDGRTVRNGVARAPGGSLAGSTSTLGTSAMRLHAATDTALPELVQLTSAAAARFLGLQRDLVPGTPANLVVLEPGAPGHALRVARVMRQGRWAVG
ncbi:amidohydrolase family protein [Amnibacterium sp. CER49]|uniref:N-acetylglucosamine-6-phosphate deacetylase n=1 Tax=Amnibacterium sp. CER49 TaxID=3039161 RepID=UPI002449AF82|nr:amidohydrolase family protein [Amnibacterium sp. CER49]MDH2442599.1 amidohydrolase family protein [Amnibacterium sp. CER49]